MINIIQNTIGALRRRLGISTDNLQLWDDFIKADWVGGELVIQDKSPNTNNAVLYSGRVLSFDGANDVAVFGNVNVNLKTICFWIDLGTTTEQIINLTSTHSIEVVSGVITLNGTWSNSNIYIDGAASTSIGLTYKRVVVTTDTNILVDDLDFARIGTDYGSLDLTDVQIYDAEFTLADAVLDYNNPNNLIFNVGGSVALSNLKGYWALSEGAGSIVYDSSGQGNNGAITGATYNDNQPTVTQVGMMDRTDNDISGNIVTLIQAPNNLGFDIRGESLILRENSFNINGSGYAEIPDDGSLDFGTGAFSIDGWAKFKFINSGSSSGNCIYTNGGNISASSNFSIATDRVSGSTDGTVKFYIGTSVAAIHTFEIEDGTWFYFAGTRAANGDAKLYVNGLEVDTGSSSDSVTNALSKYVGKDKGANRYYKDLISVIRLYSRDLTAKEITNHYKLGLAAHT